MAYAILLITILLIFNRSYPHITLIKWPIKKQQDQQRMEEIQTQNTLVLRLIMVKISP